MFGVVFAQFRCRTSPIQKTGVGAHTNHEFSPPEQFLRFSQRTCPIHYFRSKTHVWGGFAQFRCCTSPIPKTGVVHTKHEFSPPEPFLRFAQRTCPIHYFRSKTHVWCGFAQFRCGTSPFPKTGVGVHTSTSFCHRNRLFVFHNEHAQSTTLGPKIMFRVVSCNFVAARHPFRKRVSGCIQSTCFCHQNHFVVFLQRTCPIHYFRSKTHVWGGFAQFR
jgi:RNA polymerase subunit RPABC4/transcription elongation factor Spt4